MCVYAVFNMQVVHRVSGRGNIVWLIQIMESLLSFSISYLPYDGLKLEISYMLVKHRLR